MTQLVECVPNFSEGRDMKIIDAIADAIRSVSGAKLLDVDPGADTNRTVYTLVGTPAGVKEAAFQAAKKANELIDMSQHKGAHPRMGAMDVCPFVPVCGVTMDDCVAIARDVGKRLGDELEIPVYLYEFAATSPERQSLAEIRAGEYEALEDKFNQRAQYLKSEQRAKIAAGLPPDAVVKTISFSLLRVEYEFWGERFSFSTPAMCLLAFFVGVIGGTYGIGGGAIIAPFCVAVFHLPVYTVAGAALLGTFLTSIAGVFFYSVIPAQQGMATAPDWFLGFLFGVGGFMGMYLGARAQKFVPQKFIKLILGVLITYLALRYIFQYFI